MSSGDTVYGVRKAGRTTVHIVPPGKESALCGLVDEFDLRSTQDRRVYDLSVGRPEDADLCGSCKQRTWKLDYDQPDWVRETLQEAF